MIITWLNGGLGNQMFQYAAGLALAERRRTVLKLDVSWYRERPEYEAHNRYALSCFNITEQFATEEEIDRVRGLQLTRTERWSVGLARALRLYQWARRMTTAGRCRYDDRRGFSPEFLDLPDNTYLHGVWQSEKYPASCANLLRLHFSFRYPPQPAVEAMARRIREGGPSIAVHFRRGDYVRNATFREEIGVLDMRYYQRAVARMRERHPQAVLYLFSDDIDAVEREFHPPGPHCFVRATQPWHAYDKIRLMSLCDHAILSNSTFAWWAAWLNPSVTKIVMAPDPWLAGRPGELPDIVPVGWERLPRA